MATLALAGIANTVVPASAFAGGGPVANLVATTISSAIGSYIDSTIILPRLFGEKESGGTATTEAQAVDEGAPFRYSIGPECRVPGFLAWQPRQLRFVPGSEGGKGSSSSKAPSSPKYYTDGLWLTTRVPNSIFDPEQNPQGGGIPTAKRIWMDSKVRYLFDATSVDISSNNYRVTFRKEYGSGDVGSRRINAVVVTLTGQDPTDPTFDNLVPGQRIRVSGFDAPEHQTVTINGGPTVPYGGRAPMNSNWLAVDAPSPRDISEVTYEIRGIGTTGAGLPVLQYAVPGWAFNVPRQSSNGSAKTLLVGYGTQTGASGNINQEFYRSYFWPNEADEASLGLDTLDAIEVPSNAAGADCNVRQSQKAVEDGLLDGVTRGITGPFDGTPFPPLAAQETDVTAFPHWLTVGVDNLFLQDFGTRLPNVEVLVKADPAPVPLDVALDRILYHYLEMPRENFDLTQVDTSQVIRGYWWNAPYEGRKILAPLLIAYDLVMFERNQKLVIASRTNLEEITIPTEDLGVTADGRSTDIPTISVSDAAQTKDIKSVNVQYVDPNSGYQQSSMIFTRPDMEQGETSNIGLENLTMEPDEARKVALRALWQAGMFRRDVEFIVGPKYVGLTAGMYVNTTAMGRDWRIMVTDVTRGADGRMRASGYEDPGTIEDFPALAADLGGGSGATNSLGGFYTPPSLVARFFSLPAVRSEISSTEPEFQIAVATQSPYAEWRSAQIDSSPDPSTNGGSFFWTTLLTTNQESAIGSITQGSAPSDAVADTLNYIPPGEAFYVTMNHGELESVDEESLLTGQNQFYVNGEILAVSNCELDATVGLSTTYKCYGSALRGLHGTESKIAAHGVGSQVVYLAPTAFISSNAMPASDIGVTKYYRATAYADDPETAENQEEQLTPENVRPFSPAHLTGTPIAPSSVPAVYDDTGTTTYSVGDLTSWTAPGGGTVFVTYRCIQAHTGSTSFAPTGSLGGSYWELLTYADVRIDWNRRSRIGIQIIPDQTPGLLESSEEYVLEIMDGTSSTVVRTVTGLTDPTFLYSVAMREQDDNLGPFNARVRQIGTYLSSPNTEATLPNA